MEVYSLPCLKKKKKKKKINDREHRQLVDNIFKQSSTSLTVPYFVGIAEFLTNVIPLICRSFRFPNDVDCFSRSMEG